MKTVVEPDQQDAIDDLSNQRENDLQSVINNEPSPQDKSSHWIDIN